ncbi:kinase domain containing protein [Elaphomyces granulatus]
MLAGIYTRRNLADAPKIRFRQKGMSNKSRHWAESDTKNVEQSHPAKRQKFDHQTFVALKIMIPGDAGDYECSMQKKIMNTVQDTSNLVTYLTSFSLPGYRGNHQVLVFPVRGPNFRSVMLNQISMVNRMSAARQLLKALECLHNANIVHNNLSQDSVMWGVVPFDNLNTKTKYEYVGRPKKIALPGDSWKAIEDAVYLGDFGMATEAGTEAREKVLSPMNTNYYAPERFHNVNPSFSSDMWSYMCLFSNLYLGNVPWSSYSNMSMVTRMVETLGCYNSWGTSADWWYDHPRKPYPKESLKSIIQKVRPEVGEVERDHIVSIMEKVFCYSPDQRSTATELLQDPSFQAVMEIYCC